jgi:mono/diheme cytochrome c family protein
MKTHPCLLKAARVAMVTALALTAGGGIFVIAATADDARPETESKTVKKLTGAELYALNCNRCHAERYPTEFNSIQWQTLLTHMRVSDQEIANVLTCVYNSFGNSGQEVTPDEISAVRAEKKAPAIAGQGQSAGDSKEKSPFE